ncbi:predicted protein [Naegleria gruberi]|uniref:Predicted protein n=1 Tax=Naegleria gruberi TaxID=5762 RepID=D2V6F9_NAEGR|nr:uncharacterized protein NAEGRDRAFT_64421 [Naegleria gruberi]EFC47439.1 predicted protein [Naegleria gruberi]|eukprot:XP_002680183.1 predicted protein [Naegleria gruberi strain NEG-M]
MLNKKKTVQFSDILKEEVENDVYSVQKTTSTKANNTATTISPEDIKSIKEKLEKPISREVAMEIKKKAILTSDSDAVQDYLFEEDGGQEGEEEEDPSDCLERRIGVKVKDVILIYAWLILGALLIYYVYSSVNTYVVDRNKPATNVAYTAQSKLSFPAVTICNWNTGDDPVNDIALDYCFHATSNDSTHEECKFPITKKKIVSGDQIFSCLVLNNDTRTPLQATKTGYLGTISVIVTIKNVTLSSGEIRSSGVQVTFHNIGETAQDLLLNETKCATPNFDNNFSISKVVSHTIRPTPFTKTFWESSYSAVELVKQRNNKIMVSFAYNTLNIQQVTEYEASNWLQLLGEISGMASTLYGFGFVMFWRTCLWLPIAIKKKSVKVVWEELN